MNISASDCDMTGRYESKWFFDQQPNLSYFARDECCRSLTTISRRQLDQKIMRVCISYMHLYPIKSLNHTSPFRKCKLYFWANIYVASTLCPNIKWQKISEYQFRLKTDQVKLKTTPNPLRTGRAPVFRQEEAQDSPLEEVGGGWRPWAVGRPPWSAEQACGPHGLNQPRVASPLDA